MAERSSPGLSTGEANRLELPDGSSIAYHALPGMSPGILFLGGFMSDMTGTKASHLASWCRDRSRSFVRFDYTGHGASSGSFTEGTISRWSQDALHVLDALTEGPQILVGSSMGGWLMLLVALERPRRVAGLVGIAPAPDFTEELISAKLDDEARAALRRDGIVRLPSEYSDEPYTITRELIDDGRRHLLLAGSIGINCPVRLLHGLRDDAVPWQTSIRLVSALTSPDVTITIIKEGDHRLSAEADLARLERTIAGLIEAASPAPENR